MWLLGGQAGEFGGTVFAKLNHVLPKQYKAISKLEVKKEATIEVFVGFPVIFISKSKHFFVIAFLMRGDCPNNDIKSTC